MKKHLLLAITLLAAPLAGFGQDALTPSTEKPKTPAKPDSQSALPVEAPHSPRSAQGDKPYDPSQPNLAINGVIIVKSSEEIVPAGVPATNGLVVRDIPFLNGPDFSKAITPFIGRKLTENTIRDLQDAIILYSRTRGKLLVDVILPEQSLDNGVLQIWYLEGHVGKITVNNPGHKWFKDEHHTWFSDDLIRKDIRLQSGDEIDSKKLTDDLNWVNNNPFRQVDAVFKPGDRLALTDVQLDVQDRLPLRVYGGYEDSGTRFTGGDRLLAGFNWGNVFGLDQQLNYQYATDFQFDRVRAHAASYIIPLPWRHTITIFGSYIDGHADFTSIGNPTEAAGISEQVSLRYTIPLTSIGHYQHELSGGFDFKRSNNNLESGGATVVPNVFTEIDQFEAGYSGVLPDAWGRTSLQTEFYYSPGGMSGDNETALFQQLRTGTQESYVYGRVNLERDTALPAGFSWILKAWAQGSDARLLPSEELSLGGHSTIRGYDELVVSGDKGWVIDNELRTPPISLLGLVHCPDAHDQLQLLGFFDYGSEYVLHPTSADLVVQNAGSSSAQGIGPSLTLYSAGGGLRYTVGTHFSLRFDYGVPLNHYAINEHRSRAHLGALLSF